MDGLATQCGMVRQATGGGGGDSWSPAELGSALMLWLDGADASTITVAGTAVIQWDDKSGNNHHAVQPLPPNQPAYGVSTINGLNVVDVDGNDRVVTPEFTVDDVSVVTVFKHIAEDFIVIGTTANIYAGVGQDGSTSTNQSNGWKYSDSWIDGVKTVANSPRRTDFYSAIAEATRIVVVTASNTQTRQMAPWSYSADSFKPKGSIAEYVMTTGIVSDADRQKLEGYMAHKWGLQASLPAGHPYKSAPPTV